MIRSASSTSVISLVVGSVLAQGITLAAAPIVTRLYTPDEIGLYSLLLTAASMFGPVVCARYDLAVVFEADEDRVAAVIKLCVIACVVLSTLLGLGYALFLSSAASGSIPFPGLFLLTFMLLIGTGLANTLSSYNNRQKQYLLLGSVTALRALSKNVLMIVLGSLRMGGLGMLVSELAGQVVGINYQSRSLKRRLSEIAGQSRSAVSAVARDHWKQPAFSVPASLSNSFSYSSINLFIASLFGLGVLGFYSMSFRVLGLPLDVISNNISTVYFERASREFDRVGHYKSSFLKANAMLFALAVPMGVFMFYFAPDLFAWIFGGDWAVAGRYVRILAPMFALRFVVMGLSRGLLVSRRQGSELLFQLFFAVVSVGGFLAARHMGLSVEGYLLLISVGFSVTYLAYYVLLFVSAHRSRSRERKVEGIHDVS